MAKNLPEEVIKKIEDVFGPDVDIQPNKENGEEKNLPHLNKMQTSSIQSDTSSIDQEDGCESYVTEIQVATGPASKLSVMVSGQESTQIKTHSTVTEGDNILQQESETQSIDVNNTCLFTMMHQKTYKVPVLPALLMSGGLPYSGKSEAIQKLFNLQSKPPPGFSCYEAFATGLTTNSTIEAWSCSELELCYDGCLSGIKRNLALEDKPVHKCNFINDYNTTSFEDLKLEHHLHKSIAWMSANEAKREKERKGLKQGAGFIKVWDLTFNSIALQFILCFSGHLHNSYMWLFTDVDRDTKYLHKPPESSETMRQSRLEYLLHSSKLTSSLKQPRKDACTVFAKVKSQDDETNLKLTKLQRECQNAAPQLGVEHLINERVKPINFANTRSHVLWKFLKQQIAKDYEEIPVSYIFLRGALASDNELLFMTRRDLKKMAMDCGIKEENFEHFCCFFTSFGSILDVHLINSDCDIVIINPDKFLSTLDHAFNPEKIKKEEALSTDGILTDDRASVFFGQNKHMYIKVLEAVGLATKVTGQCPSQYAKEDDCFYMPSVRKKEEVFTYHLEAVQLITSVHYPSLNLIVAITKYLLKSIPASTLHTSGESNITKISFKEDSVDIIIKIVYQGGVIEFLVETTNTRIVSSSVSKIIKGCQKIAEDCIRFQRFGKPQYKFAVLCAKDDLQIPYNFSRKHHILPDDEFCDRCVQKERPNEFTKAWSKELRNNAIPHKLKLNGNLTPDDILMLAKEISTYTDEAIIAIKKKLDCPIHPLPLPEDKADVKLCLFLIIAITRWVMEHPHKESTKTIMARKLVELHDEFKTRPDRNDRKIGFKELARKLDMQTMTAKQIKNLQEEFTSMVTSAPRAVI